MKTTELQQEFIVDEFSDIVNLASEIIGFRCCDTTMQGDSEKGDKEGTKYQITADPYSARTLADRINLAAFEDYFYENFGKWKDRAYFDTPSQAFFALIKAWQIWNKHLSPDLKQGYLKTMQDLHSK